MWSPERNTLRPIFVALALTAALAAGGCNVRPLYGTSVAGPEATSPTATGYASSVSEALAEVDVAPIEGRVGQKVRNDLLYLMNGGNPTSGSYIVRLKVSDRYTNTITRAISGLPGGRNFRLIVTYTLKKVGAEDNLSEGTVTRIASTDYFNQRFSNDRAAINAQDRLAQEVATEIHLRLASYFATGRNYDKALPDDLLDADRPKTYGDAIFKDTENTYGAPDQ